MLFVSGCLNLISHRGCGHKKGYPFFMGYPYKPKKSY